VEIFRKDYKQDEATEDGRAGYEGHYVVESESKVGPVRGRESILLPVGLSVKGEAVVIASPGKPNRHWC
jgi:hypothetical protein